MRELQQWLDEAKAKGMKNVFITFHNPVFCRSGFGAIPEAQNPRKTIAPYAKDLDIAVFNGHVHTTEIYEVDGVKKTKFTLNRLRPWSVEAFATVELFGASK